MTSIPRKQSSPRGRPTQAATAVLVGVTDMVAIGVFALMGFHLAAGWKTHRLARAPHPRSK